MFSAAVARTNVNSIGEQDHVEEIDCNIRIPFNALSNDEAVKSIIEFIKTGKEHFFIEIDSNGQLTDNNPSNIALCKACLEITRLDPELFDTHDDKPDVFIHVTCIRD